MTVTVELNVNSERAEQLVLQDLIDAQNGVLEALRDTLAHFVVNGTGEYLPLDDWLDDKKVSHPGARSIIGQMTLAEMKHWSGQMRTLLQESAVPKASEKDSGSPSDTA